MPKTVLGKLLVALVLVAWEGVLIYGIVSGFPNQTVFYGGLLLLLAQAYTLVLSLTIYRSESRRSGELSQSFTVGTALALITVAAVWFFIRLSSNR